MTHYLVIDRYGKPDASIEFATKNKALAEIFCTSCKEAGGRELKLLEITAKEIEPKEEEEQ